MIYPEPILTSHLANDFPSLKLKPVFNEKEELPIVVYDITESNSIYTNTVSDLFEFNVQLTIYDDSYTSAKSLGRSITASCKALEKTNGSNYYVLFARDFNGSTENDKDVIGFSTTISFTLTIQEV